MNQKNYNMEDVNKRLENLKNYTEISTPYKTLKEFKKELEVELETFVGTKKQIDEKVLEISEKSSKLYREHQQKINTESGRKIQAFKMDLAIVNGVENNPKLDLLWGKAWEHGHSSGLSDVKYYFEDLVELID